MLGLSLIFVSIRLYVRLFKLRTEPPLADYLILVAWMICLAVTVVDYELYIRGIFAPDLDNFDIPNDPNDISQFEEFIITIQKVFAFAHPALTLVNQTYLIQH